MRISLKQKATYFKRNKWLQRYSICGYMIANLAINSSAQSKYDNCDLTGRMGWTLSSGDDERNGFRTRRLCSYNNLNAECLPQSLFAYERIGATADTGSINL